MSSRAAETSSQQPQTASEPHLEEDFESSTSSTSTPILTPQTSRSPTPTNDPEEESKKHGYLDYFKRIGPAAKSAPKDDPVIPKYRATRDYAAACDRELSMTKGEVMLITSRTVCWYWWLAKTPEGKLGYVPKAWLEEITAENSDSDDVTIVSD